MLLPHGKSLRLLHFCALQRTVILVLAGLSFGVGLLAYLVSPSQWARLALGEAELVAVGFNIQSSTYQGTAGT